MAWIKIPKEHHPIFLELLPDDPRIETKAMFGGLASMVGGHMMAGLFARSMIVRLGEADYAAAVARGAEPFDPMGNGVVMSQTLLLPEQELRDRKRAKAWLAKALAHALTLPPKKKKGAAPKPTTAATTAKKRRAKKAPARRTTSLTLRARTARGSGRRAWPRTSRRRPG